MIEKLSFIQKILLTILSAYLLWTIPSAWLQYPDSGYYLGTATTMLDTFRYWFNFQPNLQYYPGTSIVISVPLFLAGENFWVLQGFMGVISLLGIWGVARYFSVAKYGVVGFFAPFFVICSGIVMIHFYALISDTLFLSITIAALLCWRHYDQSGHKGFLLACCALVAFSSLVRLQGLFFCGALGLALLIHVYQYNKDTLTLSVFKMLVIGGAVCLPFVLWTLRNYLAHTPDTFNMANGYFFGLKGLSIYAKGLPGNASSEVVEAAWQFPLYRTSMFVGGLFESWYGGVSTLNRHIITVTMLLLIGVGVRPWAKRANKLELLYVGFSLVFISKDILLNKNLHIVYRYWIPMLPFIVIMLGFGIKTIASMKALKGLKKPAQYSAITIVCVLMLLSLPNLAKIHGQKDKLQNEQDLITRLSEFAHQELPLDAVIATVDWGVLPYVLQRRSIPLLNDPDNKQSIARMLKYRTEYLVTYDKFGRMSEPAEYMVEQNPQAFTQLFQATSSSSENNLIIRLYKVDLNALNQN
ncbi:hypothetical protein [Aliiglaciecola sp. NS0011-25]|uniref:ArnT family glycosyltransferase n=1 Tax=Aliiglaciecola sp. NS0011-25 TaxID=3127654 RepID=UPI00310552B7